MPELFIYYRVGTHHEAAACAAVTLMQDGLCASHAGLRARLLRRPESTDGRSTFMEIYALPATADGGESGHRLLATAIETAALATLAPWLLVERHVEVFVPCA